MIQDLFYSQTYYSILLNYKRADKGEIGCQEIIFTDEEAAKLFERLTKEKGNPFALTLTAAIKSIPGPMMSAAHFKKTCAFLLLPKIYPHMEERLEAVYSTENEHLQLLVKESDIMDDIILAPDEAKEETLSPTYLCLLYDETFADLCKANNFPDLISLPQSLGQEAIEALKVVIDEKLLVKGENLLVATFVSFGCDKDDSIVSLEEFVDYVDNLESKKVIDPIAKSVRYAVKYRILDSEGLKRYTPVVDTSWKPSWQGGSLVVTPPKVESKYLKSTAGVFGNSPIS